MTSTVKNIKCSVQEKCPEIKFFPNFYDQILIWKHRGNANYNGMQTDLIPHRQFNCSIQGFKIDSNALICDLILEPELISSFNRMFNFDSRLVTFNQIQIFRINNLKGLDFAEISQMFESLKLNFKVNHSDFVFKNACRESGCDDLHLFLNLL